MLFSCIFVPTLIFSESDWDVFFNQDATTTVIRNAVPVQPSGGGLSFIHKSVQEFFVASYCSLSFTLLLLYIYSVLLFLSDFVSQAKCIVDSLVQLLDASEVKSSGLSKEHPLTLVAHAMGRKFTVQSPETAVEQHQQEEDTQYHQV